MIACPICASRRRFLMGAAALGAGAALGIRGTAAAENPPQTLIDFHFHVGAPKLAALQEARSGHGNNPSAQELLNVMDAGGTAIAVCSTIIPTDVSDDVAAIRAASRDANEHMAKMKSDHPTRFRHLASLPLPDVDATLKEVEYAFDTLHADGVHMPTNTLNYWLGEPFFAPLLDELNRRKAVVKTHPNVNACCRLPNFAKLGGTGIDELGMDTQRAITMMLFSGSAAKYHDMKLIWSHAGGSLLGQLQRYRSATASGKWKAQMPNGPEYELKRHYYDTAQCYHPITLAALKSFVPNSQIVFGTDWPFVTPKDTIAAIRDTKVFSETEIAGWATNARYILGEG